MTALTMSAAADPLAPIRATLRAMAARPDQPSISGLLPGLTLDTSDAAPGWRPATAVTSGQALESLLDTAHQRWQAAPHAAAALAFKSYSYWVALPAVLGYAAARRVPLMRPEAVAVRWSARGPFLVIGLTSVEVAVLPSDPLAVAHERTLAVAHERTLAVADERTLAVADERTLAVADERTLGDGDERTLGRTLGVRVVADEDALLRELRESTMDEHLAPIVDQIHARRHLSRHTLWGSLAAGVAHGLSRAAGVVSCNTTETATRVLTALGLEDLVDITPARGPRTNGAGLNVHRRTCCLAFTLPRPKICTDCCIPDRLSGAPT